MKPRSPFSLVLVLAIFAVFGTELLHGQGTDLGTIRGTVTDSSGAVVPNASVTILDVGTGETRHTTTNSRGDYQMFGLPSGTYKVTLAVAGMGTEDITGVVLNGSDVATANGVLKVASTAEQVVVTAEAPIIDSADQTISETITSTAVIDLPRDSRDVYDFLYLNPNIVQGTNTGEFKFLGAQSYGASFSVDGQRSNGGIFGDPTATQPTLEAVGDINIMSNDFSAEYAGIANIRVTTKRGGNNFHGSAFYNNSNSALAAWTVQDILNKSQFAPTAFQTHYPTPYFNINDIGGSLGGPIPGFNKTWFFAAYEREWNVGPVNVQSNTLPHPSLMVGDFRLMDDANKPDVPSTISLSASDQANYTVGGNGLQFTQIPPDLLNPDVQKLISTYFPKIGMSAPIDPTTGRIPGYGSLVSAQTTRDLGTLRVDHDFSDNDHVYAVYNAGALTGAGNPGGNSGLVQAPYTGLGLTQTVRRNNTISVSYTHAFGARIVNEARAGYNHQKLRLLSNTTLESFLSSIGFDQSDIAAYAATVGQSELTTHGHPAILFSGAFADFRNGGRNTDRPQDQDLSTFGDTLTWNHGTHNFKMGADFVRNAAVDGFAVNRGNPRGSMTYTGSGVDPFADFLLGQPPTTIAYINSPRPPMDVYNWEQGFFFQDDWKVSSRLTLNLGLRYELITPFIENHDLLANFDPNFTDPQTGLKGRFIVPSDKTLPFLDTRISALAPVVTAAQSGLGIGRGLVRMDKNNLAPRVGMAFRITDKTVLRGGYGFYYPTSAAQGIRDPIATNPFNQGITRQNKGTPIDGWPGLNSQNGFSPLTGGDITKGFGGLPAINAVPFGLQQPRIQQYNVTFERELGQNSAIRFSYLGSTLSGLIAGVDLNALHPSNNPFGTTVDTTGSGIADGVTPCDPVNNGDCTYSQADLNRQPFPGLGDFLLTYGNFGHGQSNAFQTQFEHRYSHGLLLNLAYTYLDQKSTGLDTGNSSLGGIAYNPFEPNHDYGQESFVPHSRFVAYGVYDLPVGRGKKLGNSMSGWMDTVIGGWQTTFNLFAKSGTGFTPFLICDDCFPVMPGNIGVTSIDAVGDFNAEPSFRPLVIGNPNHRVGNQIWDPNAFALPPIGADAIDNPKIAKRNMLMGPGTWGVNLGLHKEFHFGERVIASLGADVDNLFNHPLWSPDDDYGGGGGPFALLGDFNVSVDQTPGQTPAPHLLPLNPSISSTNPDMTFVNPDFGRLKNTFTQDGVNSRRTIRLRLRITF